MKLLVYSDVCHLLTGGLLLCLYQLFWFFSERELMFMLAICRRPSVCLSVVCRLSVVCL